MKVRLVSCEPSSHVLRIRRQPRRSNYAGGASPGSPRVASAKETRFVQRRRAWARFRPMWYRKLSPGTYDVEDGWGKTAGEGAG